MRQLELNYDFFIELDNKQFNLNLSWLQRKHMQRRIASVMKNARAFTLEDYQNEFRKR